MISPSFQTFASFVELSHNYSGVSSVNESEQQIVFYRYAADLARNQIYQ